MALADDIDKLRTHSLAALKASHDYYTHTREAWRLIQQLIQQGRTVTFQNQWTGMTVTEKELPGLAQNYVTSYLASATFQHFVTLFEEFVFDLLRFWLNAYPQNLGKRELRFQTVLDSLDKTHIVASVVERELLGVAYKRVGDWFAYLNDLVKLNCPQPDEIDRLSEIKASRDILVHNRGCRECDLHREVYGQGEISGRRKTSDSGEISPRILATYPRRHRRRGRRSDSEMLKRR